MSRLNTLLKLKRDFTREEIIDCLREANWTLSSLARHHEVSLSGVRLALYGPFPRGELRIAEALDVQPAQLWPSRYGDDGEPINRMGRPRFLPTKIPPLKRNDTRRGKRNNVKEQGAV